MGLFTGKVYNSSSIFSEKFCLFFTANNEKGTVDYSAHKLLHIYLLCDVPSLVLMEPMFQPRSSSQ